MSPAHAEAEKSIKNVAVSRTKPAAVWFEKNTPAMLQNIASMRPSWEIAADVSLPHIFAKNGNMRRSARTFFLCPNIGRPKT